MSAQPEVDYWHLLDDLVAQQLDRIDLTDDDDARSVRGDTP